MVRRAMVTIVMVVAVWTAGLASSAHASERLCDPAYEDCRTPLINYIRAEQVGIDVAFWFMQDARYKTEILNRWAAGVPVRILVDPRANPLYPGNSDMIAAFQAAGIPIRYRTASGILHWKAMVFAGQNVVEFDGANYSPTAFIYQSPYSDYEDESIYFSDDPSIVNSFKTKYDDLWLDTTNYANYANINGPLARIYPIYTKDPGLNFPQQEDYALRILKRYAAETQKIDVIMYRITDERHTNAMIAAMQRGIPVRLIGETKEYRDPSRQWVSYNMDRLYAAGVPLRVRGHDGLNHQKLVIMYGQTMAVFGSSNWTSPSANSQQEHNYFTTKTWMFQWFVDQFERKWNNTAPNGAIETVPFVPLPPDPPAYQAPASGAVGAPRSLELRWDGGPWGQVYDIYFGTDPNPPLLAGNQQLGPTDPDTPTVTQKWILPLLQPGTTYYWKIVSKTMAGLSKSGPIASFTTAGTPPPPPSGPPNASTIVLWTATDVPSANLVGNWQSLADSTAAGGSALWNPNHGQSVVDPPLASPANYFQTSFTAPAGVAYHLWVRLRAQSNSTSNNSVTLQFGDSIDQYGSPLYQIGTTEGAEVVLTDPSGTLNNWGWADNGAGATLIYFPSAGTHTMQVQQRADGAIVDQIVLSPDAFMTARPGGTLNDSTIYGSTIDGAAPPPAPPPSPPPAPPVPAPWQQQDVGAVGLPGFGNFDSPSSAFTVVAAGADVWGSADAFHFVYQPMSGDGSIVARVGSIQNTNAWSKAGVMIRETMAPGAANVFMLDSASKGLALQMRSATNGATVSTSGPAKNPPMWVRLDRTGDTFTAYQSADGVAWTMVGNPATVTMATNVFIGLATTSHNADATTTATIDHVAINGTSTCAYSVAPSGQSLAAGGGSATFSVTTTNGCAWTASSGDTSWLTVSTASGTGNATVTATATANTGAPRSATVTVAGQAFTMSQSGSCAYTISPNGQAFSPAGDNGTFTVTTANWCSWTATSNADWLTLAGASSGIGNGTVSLAAAANPGVARTANVVVAGQVFTGSQAAGSAPSGWTNQDIGAVGVAGGTLISSSGAINVTGAGADVWGTADALQFAYQPLNGDGSIVARVSTIQNVNAWTKAGVMIRETVDAGSAQAFMLVSPGKGLAFQRRTSTSGSSTSTSGTMNTAPYWVRLDRVGSVVNAYQSSDGVTWALVDCDTLAIGGSVLIGLGVSSHSTTAAATATFDQVSITPGTPTTPTPLPSGWSQQDIGSVGITGSGAYNSGTGTFVDKGSGADIGGTVDGFHFVYKPMTGDGVIVGRVATLQNTNSSAKAGVMMRETLTAGSAHAFMTASATKGTMFSRRTVKSGTTTTTAGPVSGAPIWLKLERVGNTLNGYTSPDGATWTLVGTDTVAMAANIYVGFAVSSHTATAAAQATFDNVATP